MPIPPVSEQERIVAEVDVLLSANDVTTELVTSQLARIARLRQSILKWAFEGKLVDQDPTDEPAELLLARIRAERSAAQTPPRPRGRKGKVAP